MANLGVLIGLIFLIIEIRQANQIAMRDSRGDIIESALDVIGYNLENSDLVDLRVKLREPYPELSNKEKEQATLLASAQFMYWSKVNAGAETGLLPAANEEAYVSSVRTFFRDYPGLKPYLKDILGELSLSRGRLSRIYEAIFEEVEKAN